MKDKALRQALEFLEQLGENHWGNRPDVIATIKEALAETDSDAIETLVYMAGLRDGKKMEREKPTYRKWVGLTDDEFDAIDPKLSLFQFYKALEAKLKEKNNG